MPPTVSARYVRCSGALTSRRGGSARLGTRKKACGQDLPGSPAPPAGSSFCGGGRRRQGQAAGGGSAVPPSPGEPDRAIINRSSYDFKSRVRQLVTAASGLLQVDAGTEPPGSSGVESFICRRGVHRRGRPVTACAGCEPHTFGSPALAVRVGLPAVGARYVFRLFSSRRGRRWRKRNGCAEPVRRIRALPWRQPAVPAPRDFSRTPRRP